MCVHNNSSFHPQFILDIKDFVCVSNEKQQEGKALSDGGSMASLQNDFSLN